MIGRYYISFDEYIYSIKIYIYPSWSAEDEHTQTNPNYAKEPFDSTQDLIS